MRKNFSNHFKSENDELLSKFEATLLGSLIGDCFGKKCEGIWGSNLVEIIDEFRALKESYDQLDLVVHSVLETYTHDTALTKAVCQSLINKNDFVLEDMANTFQKTFLKDPNRGYTDGSAALFKKLSNLKKSNQLTTKCLLPAMELYNDICLSDNCAVRCAPIALFTYYKSLDEMKLICELTTKLTHSHDWAVIGAMQQCFAIREALNHSRATSDSFDLDVYFTRIIEFVSDLERNYKLNDKYNYENLSKYSPNLKTNFMLYLNQKTQMINCNSNFVNYENLTLDNNPLIKEYIEKSNDTKLVVNDAYSSLLKKIYKMIKRCRRGEKIHIESLYRQLAKYSCLSSIQSVPIALFVFMVSVDPKCKHELNAKLETYLHNSVDAFKQYHTVERTILYAISYGGDTDRVCAMAGALAGAYSSTLELPSHLVEKCESFTDVRFNAQKLYELNKLQSSQSLNENEQ